ncbi:EAL domain-containing protein [Pseudoduganella umbonata]|uniref:Diguanylate cyclase (GGDEF)-like protein/PAS domain S-box-containing protein n=1 Tax=Pseudoduganella umbonata TaxID=864828 RepID=A0A4P8HLR2_9BURK|nr:EAL domain-containing protein [Pseudoduganella umbonata]MBB3224950.1 diguanylate cyclase (GGDEF)-like protein/PAS domain S-box-containing protein [Pseudoduganella umbonata]QCP09228.1 EAL domain-containing protein [Pseudoduganella umbonata]
MPIIVFIARALLATFLLLPLLPPSAVAGAPLRVALDQNYPPFVFRNADGQLEGYSIDIWRLWEQRTGVKVELHAVDWPRVQPLLENGQVDVADTIFHTAARARRYDYSAPYASVATSIYADTSIAGLRDSTSLSGFQVAVQAGDACVDRLRAISGVSVRVFPTYASLLDALSGRGVRLFCKDDYAANYDLYRLDLNDTYAKAFELGRDELHRAVRKGDTATFALVERGMAQITPAETAALRDKWMARPLGFARYARPLVEGMTVLGGVVLLLAAWLLSMRRAVRMRTRELETEKAQLRTLVESSTDVIWLKDAAGLYQACNQRLLALLGLPREQVIGKDDVTLFGEAAAERYRRDDVATLLAGRALLSEDEVAIPGEAGDRVFETIKTPVLKPDGTVLGVLGVARDMTERRQRERTIREQERLLQEMSALASIGAWELAPATGVFQWTGEVARIYGTAPGQPLTLEHCLACRGEEERLQAGRALDAAATHGTPFDLELDIDTGAGRKWVRILCSPVLEDGRVAILRGTVQDVTHRRNLEESMRMANLIYQTSLEAIVVTDEANRIVDANPAFLAQAGRDLAEATLAEVTGTRPRLFESSTHDNGFYARMEQQLKDSGHWQGEVHDRDGAGASTAKFVDIRVIRRPDGRIYRHVIQFHDISAQKQKDELLWRQTNFDTLTGLPNRRLFLDRLEQDIRKAHGAGAGLGVLLLDLDRFKDINDSFGHARGDAALVELTRRVAGCVPEDATMGRLGGDSFALVTGEFDRRPHLEAIAQAAIEAVAAPLRLGPADMAYVTASVGISVYPDDGTDAAELVKNAEHAMRLSKQAGRGRFQYFTPSLQRQAHAKLMLTNELREALARQQLHVYYQPIVEVATGGIHKAETLLRWRHPERGMISPAQFIPLAEESGLIAEIGDWVLGEAIASIRRWQRMYGRVIELSVNISPTQFDQRGPLSWLDRLVAADLPHHSLTVEITEGVLVNDTAQVARCLGRLHAAGARVSIDDFGTGFSALSYLKQFDVDYLKIDKSFIDNLASDSSDRALTEAIVDLAHRLGIEAIAEGVENGAQRDALAAIGCDYIQGYFYSQAVPREAFEGLLEGQAA